MTVAYYPVGVAVVEYNREIFSDKVRALVFEPNSALSNAGAYGVNDLNIVRYTFSGKAARAYLKDPKCFESLLDLGEQKLNKYFPVGPENRLNYTTRIFDSGLCAYTKDHHSFLKRIKSGASTLQGLHLTGDYIMGASIEACFRSSYKTVQRIAI